ncbi:MAG: N-acetyltransferase [Thermoplasmata archaeon]|nr:MAG: N-acetyltransferase [Thermoplasmata archaeon]
MHSQQGENNVKIRQEQKSDHQKVYDINKQAFNQENESKLIEKIRNGENFVPELSLVAELNGEIVGHILFSKIKIIGDAEYESLSLAPMAVAPKHQKQGIGGELVKTGLETAKKLGFESVILVGHSDYYPRFGLKKSSLWGIKCPFEVPDEAFMAIELVEDSLKNKKGYVQFPKEFMEVE